MYSGSTRGGSLRGTDAFQATQLKNSYAEIETAVHYKLPDLFQGR